MCNIAYIRQKIKSNRPDKKAYRACRYSLDVNKNL